MGVLILNQKGSLLSFTQNLLVAHTIFLKHVILIIDGKTEVTLIKRLSFKNADNVVDGVKLIMLVGVEMEFQVVVSGLGIFTINCSPLISLINSISGCDSSARLIPEPSPLYGKTCTA